MPLHRAAYNVDDAAVKVLLKFKADPNATTCDNRTPLHKVAIGVGMQVGQGVMSVQGVRQLDESTARAWLSAKSIKVATALLQARADPDIQSGSMDPQRHKNGETALHVAVALGNSCLADAMLQYGADMNIQSATGLTPLDAAEGMAFERIPGMRDSLGAAAATQRLYSLRLHLAQDPKDASAMALMSQMGAAADSYAMFQGSLRLAAEQALSRGWFADEESVPADAGVDMSKQDQILFTPESSSEGSSGVLVKLIGLRGRPDLNGVSGTLLTYMESRGRWQVSLQSSSQTLSINPVNVQTNGLFTRSCGMSERSRMLGRWEGL